MRRSSNWNNAVRQRVALSLALIIVMAACSSLPSIPPHFEAFERLPIHTVQLKGERLAYLDVGQGEPVILIHGFGGSMWQWEHQQTPLSAQFRLITPDLIGSGLSAKPDIEYRPDQTLDYFVGFMDALNIQQAALVGNSMGAGLAIGMALAHPDRVSRLVLIDGLPANVRERLTSPFIKRALDTAAPSWLVSFGNWLFGGMMIESVLKEIVHDPALLTPAVIERSNRNRRRPGVIPPLMTVRDTLPLWETGFAMRIGEIRHPTLIVWGDEDRVFPLSVGEELQRTIKGSSLVRIPHAGHIPQWERPDLVNRAMIEFLRP